MPLKSITVQRWEISLAFLVLCISFVAAIAWGTHLSHEVNDKNHQRLADVQRLGHQNHQLILRIQQGRLESCRRTYEGIRQAFQPFFARSRLSPEGRRDVRTFNRRINALQAQCPAQIHAGDHP